MNQVKAILVRDTAFTFPWLPLFSILHMEGSLETISLKNRYNTPFGVGHHYKLYIVAKLRDIRSKLITLKEDHIHK